MDEHGWKKRNQDADRDKKTLIEDEAISHFPSALLPICVQEMH